MYPVEIIEILDTSISRLLGPGNASPFWLVFVSDGRTLTLLCKAHIYLALFFLYEASLLE